jgi:hypothetical protein
MAWYDAPARVVSTTCLPYQYKIGGNNIRRSIYIPEAALDVRVVPVHPFNGCDRQGGDLDHRLAI